MRHSRRAAAALSLLLVHAAGPTAQAKFTPLAGFDQQVFPSYVIATASMRRDSDEAPPNTLGDARGQFGVEIVAPKDDAPVKVAIECGEYFEPSAFVGLLPKKGETYRVFPSMKYRYGKLARSTQSMPMAVTFRVTVAGGAEEEQSVTCTMRTVNDCPFTVQHGEEATDVSFTFAAYVNEQHPFVDKLLREALDIGVVEDFDGYQSDSAGVMLQAYALWDLLVQRNVQYSNITTSAAVSDQVGSQHVRLIDESINNSEANCVDGSVLWASLLQKIGVDSFLVFEPTHCYAGFYLDEEHTAWIAVETTMLGSTVDGEEQDIPGDLAEAIPEDYRDDASFPSFVAAVQYGTGRLKESLGQQDEAAPTDDDEEYESGEDDDSEAAEDSDEEEASADDEGEEEESEEEVAEEEKAPEVEIIDIPKARKAGILPIPYQNKEEFVWYDYSELDSDDEAAEDDDEAEYSDDESDDYSDEDSDDYSEDEEE